MKNQILFAVVAFTMFSSCQYDDNKSHNTATASAKATTADNNIVSSGADAKTFPFNNFTQLDIGAAYKVKITQGNEYKVTASGEAADLDKIRMKKEGNTLKIGIDRGLSLSSDIELYITLPKLEELEISGAVEVATTNTFSGNKISLDLSGATKVNMQVDVQKIDVSASGSSNIQLAGSARRFELDMSGAGAADCTALAVEEANTDFSGATSARLNVSKKLHVEASGSAAVSYKGNPSITTETSGAASIKKI